MEEEIKKDEAVTEAETEEVKEREIEEEKDEMSEEQISRKKKREFFFELALFLILGVLIGVAVKTEASKRITIGYEDYKMKIKKQDYKINELQAEMNKAASEAAAEEGSLPEDEQGEVIPSDEENSSSEKDSASEKPEEAGSVESGQ